MVRQTTSALPSSQPGVSIRRILVPTDGSVLSERAFPIAMAVASAQDAEVVLARVVEPPAWFPADATDAGFPIDGPIYQQTMELINREAREQIDPIVDQFWGHHVAARPAVLQGAAAEQLLALERKLQPDLLVMATHGRTGLRRLARGSITDVLIREGSSPVLVVPSFGDEHAVPTRIILPLDGSELAEQAIPVVHALAGRLIKTVCLFRAVARREDEEAAISQLNRIERELPDSITRADVVVREGDPAIGIVAASEPGDVIVMATHGRAGFDRFWHGSVAERVLGRTSVPMLLVRRGS